MGAFAFRWEGRRLIALVERTVRLAKRKDVNGNKTACLALFNSNTNISTEHQIRYRQFLLTMH